jgi:glycerol-3-phosphate dehydrogenase (NAD(P)+)
METFGVVGQGRWGCALATHLSNNKRKVIAWSRSQIHGASYKWCSEISHLRGVDAIVLALPAIVVEDLLPTIKAQLHSSILLSAVKGLTKSSLTVAEAWSRVGGDRAKFAVLGGPLFAKELQERMMSTLVIGAFEPQIAEILACSFEASFLRVYLSRDPLGIEIGGIIKNVIAIATGMAEGLGLGESIRASLLTRGLAEMMRFANPLGGDPQTIIGLTGLGDLLMTGSSRQSRNWQVGYNLGKGLTLKEALATVGQTAEGVSAAPLLAKMAHKFCIEAPIIKGIASLLDGSVSCNQLVQALISRPRRFEF